ncbi:Solvent efflux pump outer membrane protein SrpC [Pandoraea morbifera]|uniref:Solvent efflux pump outer membrane protein SrpC n=1 Tax=Pandoraea morbifera TaxID=2508300 RepID=A0A5E4RBN3_9BURK|nr:efflux transporter outer membrane subunit [Pandoraea morbifera]VVD60565.1 Solvent efflux pump outer membrane protein SrpC [Pandoraea morbifera]
MNSHSSTSFGIPTSILRAACLAACIGSLASCTVGPDYTPPGNALPDRFAGAVRLAQRDAFHPGESSAQERVPSKDAPQTLDTWWTRFHDPALTAVIEQVLAQNLDLRAAMARVVQAREQARAAGARQLPSLRLDGNIRREHQSLDSPLGVVASTLPGYNRNMTVYDIGLGASWELDLFGGLRRSAQTASALAQVAQAQRDGVRVSLVAEAADAYFRVRSAQRRLAIAQDQIATDERLQDIVRLRFADGLASEREVAQAEALLARARTTLPPLRIERETQLNRLDVLMGVVPGTYAHRIDSETPADDRHARPFTIPSIGDAGTPSDLLRRRPDVIAAERRLAASNARIGAALAEYYPKFSLSGVLGFETLAGGRVPGADTFQPLAALGLRWRLFDFGRIDAEVAQARGAKAEALAAYRQAMLHATEDVENAIVTLVELERQRKDLAKAVAAQTRARDSAQAAYTGGTVSLYEVLDADRQLLTVRDDDARAQADNARAAVATFRALGGGWQADAPALALTSPGASSPSRPPQD